MAKCKAEWRPSMSTDDTSATGDPHDAGTFEASLAALETIVHDLEDGQLGLGEALARYEQGVKHLKHCYQLLTAAEKKIELLTGVNDDGTFQAEPFDESSEPLAESVGRRRGAKSSRPSAKTGPESGSGDASGDDIDASPA
jgi:exodeoxyribonuclease VII small subunit